MFPGDYIFLVFIYLKPLLFIAIIIWFFIENRKKKVEMKRLEAKIDKILETLRNKDTASLWEYPRNTKTTGIFFGVKLNFDYFFLNNN